MNIPDNLLYTHDHEWIKIIDGIATIGVTDYAQGQLGDIIFIEFPNVGTEFFTGDSIGTIEAVKTVADIYAPLDGNIVEINLHLDDNPDVVNIDPYGKGWILKLNNLSKDLSHLMSPSKYQEIIK